MMRLLGAAPQPSLGSGGVIGNPADGKPSPQVEVHAGPGNGDDLPA